VHPEFARFGAQAWKHRPSAITDRHAGEMKHQISIRKIDRDKKGDEHE